MKKVLIIGAHGQVGQLLTDQLNDTADFTPVALIRKPDQKTVFEKKGVEARLASLEDSIEELAQQMKDIDAVVFSAGSGGSTGPDKTLAIDLDGAVKAMEAAETCGITRFVMVSALYTDDRSKWTASGMKPYYVAKHYADRILKSSGLKYTILRPGVLENDGGTGRIRTEGLEETESVAREDVARVIVETLKQDNTIGKIIPFTRGQSPIAAVLESC